MKSIRIGSSLRRFAVVAVVIAAAAVSWSTGRVSAAPVVSPVNVEITRFAFAPKDITVPTGTRIVWTNRDETPHTVTANDKSFGSKGLDTGDAYERTFDREGDFAYICAVHPFMTGVVHVRKP